MCVYVRDRGCVRAYVYVRAQAYACARVALLIQRATRRQIVICSVSGYTRFFDIISQRTRCREKCYWKQYAYFHFLYYFYLKHF
jgi:hypothetical protein